jgi:hypothetical protein
MEACMPGQPDAAGSAARSARPWRDGIHCGIPHAEYHACRLGVVSKSALDHVARSPAHYRAWIDGTLRDEATPALAFGAAFHCALLEPARFEAAYAVEPDFGDCRHKANREERDAWRNSNIGRELVPSEWLTSIGLMVDAVRKHPLAGRMVQDGDSEVTVAWTDSDTGLTCKARADYYVRRRRLVVDVKSTLDARPFAFRRDVAKYGYHRQDALYRAGFAAIDEPVEHFIFVAVEKAPPYAIKLYALDADSVSRGYAATKRDMDTLAQCMRTDTWPAYSGSIEQLSAPSWAD